MSAESALENIHFVDNCIVTDRQLLVLLVGKGILQHFPNFKIKTGRPVFENLKFSLKSRPLKRIEQISQGSVLSLEGPSGETIVCNPVLIYDEEKVLCGCRIYLELAPPLIELPDSVFMFSIDNNDNPGVLLSANSKAFKTFGLSEADITNRKFNQLFRQPPPSLRFQKDTDENIWECEALTTGGKVFDVELHTRLLKRDYGSYLIVSARETAGRNLLTKGLRQMERVEIFGQLAGGIAHDFNNVLAGIIGFGELAMRQASGNRKLQHYLETIVSKADGAANLVKRLLAFSNQQEPAFYPINLNHVIKDVGRFLERIVGETISIEMQLKSKAQTTCADITAIEQILTNLAINARDAMPDGGVLNISTDHVKFESDRRLADIAVSAGNYIKLSLTDSGIGMEETTRKNIFTPFFSTKTPGQGTGLGLAMVAGLIKQHHAYITCSSCPGEGTQFDMYFPECTDPIKNSVATEKTKTKTQGKETILLVEDDRDLLDSFSTGLRHYGYKVLFARDGLEALDVFEKNSDMIDIIIADMIMPEIGGLELKMLLEKDFPGIKFMLMSGANDMLEPGVPCLKKPFHVKQLAREIRKCLD